MSNIQLFFALAMLFASLIAFLTGFFKYYLDVKVDSILDLMNEKFKAMDEKFTTQLNALKLYIDVKIESIDAKIESLDAKIESLKFPVHRP